MTAETLSRRWRRPVLALVVPALAFLVVGFLRSAQVDVPFRDPHHAYLLGRLRLEAGLFVLWVAVDTVVRTVRAGGWRPFTPARLWSTLSARWTPARIGLAWVALLAYWLVYFVYRNLKSWNAFRPVRDGLLQRWDEVLFLGHHPAALVHDLLGQGMSAWVLTAVYGAFVPLVPLAFSAALILPRRLGDGYTAMAAFLWVWILGTATYYLFPSLGPFHLTPQDFAGLPDLPIQATQDRFLAARERLLADPGAHGSFASIGAFASLHVGVTAVIVGVAWWHRIRWLTRVLAVYLACVAVSTVYLGWHFFVDDLGGLAIAALAWALARLTVGVPRPPRG